MHNPAMSRYRPQTIECGQFFFTVALTDGASELLFKHIERLRQVYCAVQPNFSKCAEIEERFGE